MLSVVIPTFNNAIFLPIAIASAISLRDLGEIIIIDDCSTDDTKSYFPDKKNIFLNINRKNLGYGGNVKNALENAILNYEFDYLVEIHGDGAQFDPSATYDAMEFMKKKYDFIIGSRFIDKNKTKKGGMSKLRYYSNIILSNLAESVFNLGITEYHTGFRIYSKNYLNKVNWRDCSEGHLFSFETLALVAHHKLKIAEVKCFCDYNNMHTSISIFNAVVFTFKHFLTMIDYLLTKIRFKSGKIFR